MFYALGEDLSNIQMQNDRLVLTHASGAWGMQYQGSKSNLTDFADAGNTFITTFNNNASIATISNNTVYWPPDVDNPKFVNITTSSEIQITSPNFKQDLAAFNAAVPPVVFVDLTNSQIIVKSNHTTEATIIEISFQEAEADAGLLALAGLAFILLFLILGFILIIFLAVRRKKK